MMRTLRRNWNRLLGSFLRRRSEADLADEIESHIHHLAEEDIRRGVPPEDALRRARLQFGGIESTKESYRDQRGLPGFDTIIQDLRYALRGIRRNPGFAAVAILSLAIGIGANTAIFSIVNAVLLRPLAYKDSHRLFVVREISPQLNNGKAMPVNPLHALEWAKQCSSLESVVLMRSNRADISGGEEPASVLGVDVPRHLFAHFGVEPILGRTFLAEEEQEGSQRVVVLSESLWRARYNADRSLVGRPVLIDGQNHQVVGIIPEWFRLPSNGVNTRFEIFRPLLLSRREQGRPMGNFNYAANIRLKPGVNPAQALAEINVVEARFAAHATAQVELKALIIPMQEVVTGRAQAGLWMLAAAVGAVLLIVCLNLANLLLSRIASRTREAAIRAALGASRGRLFRQVLTESLLLAVSGGAVGILFADWSVRLLAAATTIDVPRIEEVRLDTGVLIFALCLTVGAGLLFGALPAWRLTRNDPQEALRAGSHTVTEGRRGLRLREALISLEVGLSAALLIVAGLLGGSLTRLLNVDKGFDAEHVLTVDLSLARNLYADSVVREKFFTRLLAKLDNIPGAQAAGFITALPTRGDQIWTDAIRLEGAGTSLSEQHAVNNRYASPGYFRALNIAIRKGRAFEERDRGQGVAVLSEKAVKLLWPADPNPIGRRFIGEDGKPQTLVGIVADVRGVLDRDPPPMAYYPYWQVVPGAVSVVVRTAAEPLSTAGALRAALRSEDAQLPILAIGTMEAVVDSAVAQRRFQLLLMAVFAVSALLVASLGIYGVVSYSVARRKSEIGIRMALGAERGRLLGMVIRQGMAPVVIGLAAGVSTALALGEAIRSLLFGIQPADPITIAGVAAVLLAVGILACFIPAYRAAGTDALVALRVD